MSEMEAKIQRKLQSDYEEYMAAQKEFQRAVSLKTQLDGQLKVNKGVKEELVLLKEDAELYKLIGPVLIKQDLLEARVNVDKRMEYINNEMKRMDSHISACENKQEVLQEKIAKTKQEYAKIKGQTK